MSTRSIIGTTDNTTFEGIYCHFDGSPNSMAPTLAKIITRDGADALPVLTGQVEVATGGATSSWESLSADMAAADIELPYPTQQEYFENVAGKDRNAGLCYLYAQMMMEREDGRERMAEGYGVANLGHPIRFEGKVADRDPDVGMCEWAYLFTEDLTMVVYEIGRGLMEVERFTRDDLAAMVAGDEAVMQRLLHAECGADFSRCCHMAWFHDRSVPAESRRLSMQEWVGVEPLRPASAIGAIVGGRRYEFTGSGASRHGKWEVGVKDRKGNVPMFEQLPGSELKPLPGVELIYPQTKADLVAA